MDNETTKALRRAMEKVGGPTELGKRIGCSAQRICNWAARGTLPVEYCPKIEEATGVTCEELRPDVNWTYMRRKIKEL
jgi:DNA-binding transcriptional regulator YdaS (Cro superfamily)